ncbi:MAG TPA: ATP-binding protein [Actinomycetota bacterium]|nr:ATP-binding protein [Actinomycetota bacterium]
MRNLLDRRPLERLPTIKAKLGTITVFAVAVTVACLYVLVGYALRDSESEVAFRQSLSAARELSGVAFGPNGVPSATLGAAAARAGRFALVVDAQGHVLQESMPTPKSIYKSLDGSVDTGVVDGVSYVGVPVVRGGEVAGAVYIGTPVGSGTSAVSTTAELLRGFWWQLLAAGAIAAAIGLLSARFLARGLTTPLRDMAQAARRMAQGDYRDRVTAKSRDEVGQLADAFNRMAAQLEGVEQSRRELVGNVSHELKTPISALQAHLENLLDGVEEPNMETLALMLGQCERLARLVEQLLDLSRLESGDVPLELEPVGLSALVDQVIAEVGVARADRAVAARNVVAGDLPALKADRERLHQVLFNLLDNAFRFTPAGGTVTVSAAVERGLCAVSVADTGAGIPAEHRPRVFERFYRVDSSRARSDGGTGIGLAIARSVVEGHGGRIWAEQGEAGGAVFRFVIPVWDAAPARPSGAEAEQQDRGSSPGSVSAPGSSRGEPESVATPLQPIGGKVQ